MHCSLNEGKETTARRLHKTLVDSQPSISRQPIWLQQPQANSWVEDECDIDADLVVPMANFDPWTTP